jgi:hypothetical protein
MRGDERRTGDAELDGAVHQIYSLLIGGFIGYEALFSSRINQTVTSFVSSM